MDFVQRKWIPETSSESKMYPDSVYMYDAGNFVGFLTIKGVIKQWSGFTLISRVKTQEIIEETLEPAHEYFVPMQFFSIEKYPAIVEPTVIWIPGWKIQWHHQKQPREALKRSDSQPPQSSPPPLPLKQHKNQVLHQPSLQPDRLQKSPSSQPLPKSLSGKPARSQHPSQNRNNSASKPKALPSSNPTFREKQTQSIPRMSGGPPLQSSPSGHISPLLPQHQISHPSPYPPLPSTPEGLNQPPTSSSPNHSNSQQHLSSQQVRRQHGGKSRRPTFSQRSSHE